MEKYETACVILIAVLLILIAGTLCKNQRSCSGEIYKHSYFNAATKTTQIKEICVKNGQIVDWEYKENYGEKE